uniref:Uncharacterized protein n=1 Tax=Octopus bimaculoides TaxID=37653 RepID=A0A0L8HDM6_OCTBM
MCTIPDQSWNVSEIKCGTICSFYRRCRHKMQGIWVQGKRNINGKKKQHANQM